MSASEGMLGEWEYKEEKKAPGQKKREVGAWKGWDLATLKSTRGENAKSWQEWRGWDAGTEEVDR